jgi:hypothetical protein
MVGGYVDGIRVCSRTRKIANAIGLKNVGTRQIKTL